MRIYAEFQDDSFETERQVRVEIYADLEYMHFMRSNMSPSLRYTSNDKIIISFTRV